MLDITMSTFMLILPCHFAKGGFMEEKKMFATRINKDLLKKLKILSVHQEKPINSLLEEAIQDFLKKNEKRSKKYILE